MQFRSETDIRIRITQRAENLEENNGSAPLLKIDALFAPPFLLRFYKLLILNDL